MSWNTEGASAIGTQRTAQGRVHVAASLALGKLVSVQYQLSQRSDVAIVSISPYKVPETPHRYRVEFRASRLSRDFANQTTSLDAAAPLDEIVTSARSIEPDERFNWLYRAVSTYIAQFQNAGLLEIGFALAQLKYPEDVFADILEMLGEIGDYRTERFRRVIIEKALNSTSSYVRFAAVSAALELLVDPSLIRSMLSSEGIPELIERASAVLKSIESRAVS